ncbi:early nodulin-like protein 7 [Aristolochia californica]|uniref:early nodulin-like protein 7 n=1 Tax=Aristolochia californica TaxID=171875 RepID=UPI0035DFA422
MAKVVPLVLLCCIASAAMVAVVAASKQLAVGGIEGWREPHENDTGFYTRWAAKHRFQIGDTLYFHYTNDSVLLVDKRGYYHCNTTNPIATFNDGETVINLDRSTLLYFISSFIDHCKNGQRLIVDVLTPHLQYSPPQPFSPALSPMPSSAVSVSISVSILAMLMATAGSALHGLLSLQ